MGVAIALYEDQPSQPHPNSLKRKKRLTRAEIRDKNRQPGAVAHLDDEETLSRFVADANTHGQPMLSRWTPFGRSWYHPPEEVAVIAVEVARALAVAEPGSDTARMLEDLLGLARRAVAEGLYMAVLPD
ncbi:hypothetical protein ACUN7V_20185 [Quadrisphaera oryzae]|uniref:hypothetical protein n=1 Tax=Quadrisphaera TaxID=317661 RepID=UPI001647DFDC|nr:hypothetical protein [Quadrisphaera sp. RL12-1S]MBC3763450.1 hypothetical protein [Quadrisphaera sp. RL12-1S]